MQNYFNTAALAQLSKSELEHLLATYEARLTAASSETELSQLHSQIAGIRMALNLK